MTSGQGTWSARCVETRTAGAAGGPGKPTGSNPGRALRSDPTGRFRRSELYTLLARINYHLQQWVRRKYRRLRPTRAMQRAWKRVTTQYPALFPHWQWVTGAWHCGGLPLS
jgi:hypothetical protein